MKLNLREGYRERGRPGMRKEESEGESVREKGRERLKIEREREVRKRERKIWTDNEGKGPRERQSACERVRVRECVRESERESRWAFTVGSARVSARITVLHFGLKKPSSDRRTRRREKLARLGAKNQPRTTSGWVRFRAENTNVFICETRQSSLASFVTER